jgi:twinkle protein
MQTDNDITTTETIEEQAQVPSRLIKGVYDVEEYADAVHSLRSDGLPRGVSTGWKILDEFYSVPRRQWTILTGYSGSGKSTWLDNLMCNLATLHNWKFLICSPENQPIEEHIAGLMEISSGKKFGVPKDFESARLFMTDTEYAHAFAFIGDHFQFINPPETSFNIKDIVALAEEVKLTQFDYDGFVIDPYNELEHKRPGAMSETEYISWVISIFRRFIQQYHLHGWFVAHPTKPQQVTMKYNYGADEEELTKKIYKKATLFDVSGSAHWKSKCDFGVIVHRDMQESTAPSIIEIEKVRKRYQGKKGSQPLFYDFYCNRYCENYIDLLVNRV